MQGVGQVETHQGTAVDYTPTRSNPRKNHRTVSSTNTPPTQLVTPDRALGIVSPLEEASTLKGCLLRGPGFKRDGHTVKLARVCGSVRKAKADTQHPGRRKTAVAAK